MVIRIRILIGGHSTSVGSVTGWVISDHESFAPTQYVFFSIFIYFKKDVCDVILWRLLMQPVVLIDAFYILKKERAQYNSKDLMPL